MNKLPFTAGKFELTKEQMDKVCAWLDGHVKVCPHFSPSTSNWFGSPLMYTFRPHGIGEEVVVECNCGSKLDITDECD